MIRRVGGGLLAAGGLGVAWGVAVERRWYAVRHERLEVLRRPGRLRVLLFADLHYLPGQEHRLDFLRRAVDEHGADLVVSAGDNLEDAAAIEPVIEVHRDVLASAGAPGLAVLGAHDRWGPQRGNPAHYLRGPSGGAAGGVPLDVDRFVAGLTDGGWRVLVNESAVVETAAGPVEVVGVDDPHVDLDDLSVVPSEGVDGAVLRLGLVHAPYRRVLERYDAAGFDLALAGHTHGGQLAVPGWGALVSNCDLPPAKARGTSWVGADLRLHVTAGLGHSRYYPIRFACRPELTILDLVGR